MSTVCPSETNFLVASQWLSLNSFLHIHGSVSQFDNEISKDLRPRLEKTGDVDLLQPFLDFFKDKSFQNGTTLLSLWEGGRTPKVHQCFQ